MDKKPNPSHGHFAKTFFVALMGEIVLVAIVLGIGVQSKSLGLLLLLILARELGVLSVLFVGFFLFVPPFVIAAILNPSSRAIKPVKSDVLGEAPVSIIKVEGPPFGKCPNCQSTIALKALECPKCQAVFSEGAGWKVQPSEWPNSSFESRRSTSAAQLRR
jgi:hypothetical protein